MFIDLVMVETPSALNFIEQIIVNDLAEEASVSIHTRFPPEPNGFLHIGHAKSIVLNFELAKKYGGKTNLRFDDTNPAKEDNIYVEAIKKDVQWLGYDWEDREFYASDYFEHLYDFAVLLIKNGKAYVDQSSPEEIRRMRGVPTEPGEESPYRDRPVKENLDLFRRMRQGEFEEGTCVLRAKIDMTSPNMHLRDPIMYRIVDAPHHKTGTEWKIYPMYDWAHGQSDAIEGVTYSLCTLEFEVHRPLYDWYLDQLPKFSPRPRQIEFARLNLTYTLMSKRKLLELVELGYVLGWDDPRMPTISGLRRRGYTPLSIRNFAQRVGIAKRENMIDLGLLEHSVREDLNKTAPRVMAVLNPLKVVISNYPEDQVEEMEIVNNPEDESQGTRKVPFSGEIYIEQEDFMEDPPKKFFRLGPGRKVRLKSAYIIQCDEVVKNSQTGEIEELRCSYFPDSRSGNDTSGIKVKGTLHWVSKAHALDAEVRLYDRLFKVEDPANEKEVDYQDLLNPESLKVIPQAKIEPYLKGVKAQDRFQFMRKGYFCVDLDSAPQHLVFNRTVTLRDSWAKLKKKNN